MNIEFSTNLSLDFLLPLLTFGSDDEDVNETAGTSDLFGSVESVESVEAVESVESSWFFGFHILKKSFAELALHESTCRLV